MLTLASRSPQRRAILEQIGVDFEVVVPDVEELTEGEPGAVVVENALRKARAVAGELVLEGHEAVKAARQLIGATNPIEAAPGSIRGDLGLEVQTNLVHGSDSPESAAREIGIFFPEL